LDRSGQVLLAKYQLTRMLGKGGMGEVWEGEHQLTGRRVAVKVLSDAYLSNKKVVARFGREARAASAVQHDGIVEILDQDRTDEGVPFLVMEFLEGESVGQRLKRKKKLSENETLAIMLPLLDALDAAHQAGVIHRDLKPDNVFILPGVRGEERIKILDFGISQKADEIEHRLTQEGSVLGTPHYMSPEQARGEASIDVRVDVYAAAVMFYECAVGEVPFDAGNYNALLQIIISRPPVPPRARGGEVSAAVEQVIMAALGKRREERPPNARVFRELLLEAGLQDDDVQLERAPWKFRSAPALPPLAPRSAPPKATEKPARPHALEAELFVPARTTGSHAMPRSPRSPQPSWGRASKDAPHAAPRMSVPSATSPAPAQPALITAAKSPSFPSLSLEATASARAPSPSQQIELALVPRSTGPIATKTMARAVPGSRTSGAMRVTKQRGRGLVGTLFGWLLVLGAIAALGYVASAVFKRPDARKNRKPPAASMTEPTTTP
jgi:eukaryotic-like serine/threonine-protein kinase